jgi:uncharacterized protein YxeA
MDKKVIIIGVGSILILGIGAFFFFKSKSKDKETKIGNATNSVTSNTNSSNAITPSGTSTSNNDNETVKRLYMAEAVTVRDNIFALYRKKAGYKTAGSRNAVQSDINSQLEKLKLLGYSLDYQNNLLKIG